MKNPWLQIPAEDYEGHMSDANVGQLQVLSQIFGKVIDQIHPQSLLFLGCATGNGFERLTGNEKIVGVDVNPEYLEQCKNKFTSRLPNLKLVCADLNTFQLHSELFDLVHAALIFEYVEVDVVLSKIFGWLNPGGYFTVVLQLESKTAPAISETKYHSLKTLGSIHKLVAQDGFIGRCREVGLDEKVNYEVMLPGEKKFKVIIFQKGL